MNAQPADASTLPSVSRIMPTYKEVHNLPILIDRIAAVRAKHDLRVELLIINRQGWLRGDRAEAGLDWVRFVERRPIVALPPAVVGGRLKECLRGKSVAAERICSSS